MMTGQDDHGDGAMPQQGLRAFLSLPRRRITRLDWQGHTVWLKRPEAPRSLRWRLQKGDPARAFRREAEGLRALAAAGVPVPEVLDAGPDFLFLADAGPTLAALMADPARPEAGIAAAVTAAARALGRLHAGGLAHGRPYLRDLCWNGARITLIDFERHRPRASGLRQGYDLVLFLASLLADPRGQSHLAAAVAAWHGQAPASAWRGARVWMALIRPLGPLARRFVRKRPGNREVAGYVRLLEAWPGLR